MYVYMSVSQKQWKLDVTIYSLYMYMYLAILYAIIIHCALFSYILRFMDLI